MVNLNSDHFCEINYDEYLASSKVYVTLNAVCCKHLLEKKMVMPLCHHIFIHHCLLLRHITTHTNFNTLNVPFTVIFLGNRLSEGKSIFSKI